MTTLDEAIKHAEEIAESRCDECGREHKQLALWLKELKEYREQEPCENCDYSEIMDWEQDAKTGKAKPIYWCERHKEPCNDTISRQAVLASIKNLYPDMPIMDIFGARRKWLDKYAPYFECENAIEQLPSVRPQEQIGHWITIRTIMHDGEFYCDKCKCDSPNNEKWDYCPNCGARMVEPQKSEE